MRGILLTGQAKRFLEAHAGDDGEMRSTVSDDCPWEPPTKLVAATSGPIAGRSAGRLNNVAL